MQQRFAHLRFAQSGNVVLAIFGAVAFAGILGIATSSYVRGPLTNSAVLQKTNTAQTQMLLGTRTAITLSGLAAGADCDSDGFVEPLRYVPAGVNPHPTGGGLVPLSLPATKLDPWGIPYGYCVWDHGAVSLNASCQDSGNHDYRLAGANIRTQPVVAFISAGPDKTFQTTCNAWADVDVNLQADTPLVDKPSNSDDIVATTTYNDASQTGGDLWSLKINDPGTAEIAKDIEVTGSTTLAGTLNLGSGLVLADQTSSGACNLANGNTLRRNTTTSPPTLEICYDDSGTWTWATVSGSGGGGSSAAGSNTQIQYNNNGAFAADTNFVWNETSNYLGIGTTAALAPLDLGSGTGSKLLLQNDGSTVKQGIGANQGSSNQLTIFGSDQNAVGPGVTSNGPITVGRRVGLTRAVNTDTSNASFVNAPRMGSTVIVTVGGYRGSDTAFSIPSGGVTDNQGNAYTLVSESPDVEGDGTSGSHARTYIFASANIPTPVGTFTITVDPNGAGSNTSWEWGAMEVIGIDPTNPIDRTGSTSDQDTNATTLTVSTSGATTQAHELAVSVLAGNTISSTAQTYVADGWTQQFINLSADQSIGTSTAVRTLNGTGTISHQWTAGWAGGTGLTGAIATFRGTASASTGGGSGPIAIVQSKGGADEYLGTTSLSFDSLPAGGNAVVIQITQRNGCGTGTSPVPRLTDNQGNSYVMASAGTSFDGGDWRNYIFVAPGIGAPTGTFTVNLQAPDQGCYHYIWSVIEVSGLGAYLSVDKTSEASCNVASGDCTANPTTTATDQSQELAVAASMGWFNCSYNFSTPSGWTSIFDNHYDYSNGGHLIAKILSSTGAQNASWTINCGGSDGRMTALLTTLRASQNYNITAGGGSGYVSLGFIDSSDGTTYSEKMRITETGAIGIGKTDPVALLHVAGEAILGQTNLVCDTTTSGGIRYSMTHDLLEFCNGVVWANINASVVLPACSGSSPSGGSTTPTAPSFVTRATPALYDGNNTTGTVVQSAPSSSSLQTNDLMLWVIAVDGTLDHVVWPSGWSQIQINRSGVDGMVIFVAYKFATSSEPASYTASLTYSQGASSVAAASSIYAYRGVDTTAPFIDATTGQDNNSTSSPWTIPALAVTTTVDNAKLVYIASVDANGSDSMDSGTYTAPTGFTERGSGFVYDGQWNSFDLFDKTQATAGTTSSYSATATGGNNAGKVGFLFALRPENANPISGPYYKGSSFAAKDSDENNLLHAVPPMVANNDLMLWAVETDQGDTVTWPGGWTEIQSATSPGEGAKLFIAYRVASSEPASYTATVSNNAKMSQIMVYGNTDSVTPIAASTSAGSAGTSAGPWTTPSLSLTTTTDYSKLIYIGAMDRVTGGNMNRNNTLFTAPTGFYPRGTYNDGRYSSFQHSDKTQITLGATGTISQTVSAPYTTGVTAGTLAALIAVNPGKCGAIAFNNSSAIGSDDLFWEKTTNHLGIGTTAPVTGVDVAGAIRVGTNAASCSSSLTGSLRYNTTTNVIEWCKGSSWHTLPSKDKTGTAATYTGLSTGYFIMTAGTFDGARGGLVGANADCLSDLTNAANDWNGKSTASANGWLVANNVKAWLCSDSGRCNNFMPGVTYAFARAGNLAGGGNTFTANSDGLGFSNTTAWSGSGYFNIASTVSWTGRGTNTTTTPSKSSAADTCGGWTTNNSLTISMRGSSSGTSGARWAQGTTSCNNVRRLLCIVHPNTP